MSYTIQTYRDFLIFPKEFLPLNSISKTITHNRILLGKPYNKEMFLFNESEYYTESITLKFDNYEEMKAIRDFFIDIKGKKEFFWFYSYNTEIQLKEDIKKGNSSFKAELPLFNIMLDYRPLFIFVPEINFATQIIDVADLGFDVRETYKKIGKYITFDPFPSYISLQECKSFYFMFLGSSSKDDITFDFIDLVRGKVTFSFKEITIAHYKKLGLFKEG